MHAHGRVWHLFQGTLWRFSAMAVLACVQVHAQSPDQRSLKDLVAAGDLRLRDRSIDEAIKLFSQARRLAADDADICLRLCSAADAGKDWLCGLDALAAAIELRPSLIKDQEWRFIQRLMLQARARGARTTEIVEAIAAVERTAQTVSVLADPEEQRKLLDGAWQQLLPHLSRSDVDVPELWACAARLSLLRDDVIGATLALEAIVRLRPDHARDAELRPLVAALRKLCPADRVTKASDENKRLRILRGLARAGDAEAMCQVGLCCRNGTGMLPGLQEALEWFLRGAEAGSPKAAFHLGMAFLEGEGIDRDAAQGEFWLKRAIASNYAPARAALAKYHSTLDPRELRARQIREIGESSIHMLPGPQTQSGPAPRPNTSSKWDAALKDF